EAACACRPRGPRTRHDACRGSRRWWSVRREGREGCRRMRSWCSWIGAGRYCLTNCLGSPATRLEHPWTSGTGNYVPVSASGDARMSEAPQPNSFVRLPRPLLLIDVDGVISLFGFDHAAPPAGRYQLVDGITHFLSVRVGEHLRR